jgi:hypothetical protein
MSEDQITVTVPLSEDQITVTVPYTTPDGFELWRTLPQYSFSVRERALAEVRDPGWLERLAEKVVSWCERRRFRHLPRVEELGGPYEYSIKYLDKDGNEIQSSRTVEEILSEGGR